MGLGFVKIGVDAVVCEEGVVGSVFGDAAVVETMMRSQNLQLLMRWEM